MSDATPTLRASTSEQWVHCSESAWLAPQYPNDDSDASKEGTAAHEMAELILKGIVSDGIELIDRQASNGVVFSDDMLPHVQTYVDHVRERGVAWWVEEQIAIQFQNGVVTGTCDGAAFSFEDATGTLYIDDFKYGFGPVEVFENWQMLIYAIGMFLKLGSQVRRVKMTIIQPRGYHHQGPVREWEIDCDHQIQNYIRQLGEAVTKVFAPDRNCVTGKWCRYCKVRPDCAAFKAAAMNGVDVIMQAIPNTDTPEQVAHLLDVLNRASDLVKHSLDAISTRAEAMIASGQPVPGYNVEPGKGKRKFKDDNEAIAFAQAMGVEIFEKKIVTPAQLERNGISKAIVNSLTVTPSTAPRLVKRDVSTQADKVFK